MRRVAIWMLMLSLLLPMPAGAEEEVYQDSGTGRLVLVDRVHDPSLSWDFDEDASLLHIWFPRIHDCDAAVICCGGKTAVIDCCDLAQAPRLAELLIVAGVRQVDWLFNTHPHHDHLEGLTAVHQLAPVQSLEICFHEYYNDRMMAAIATAKELGISVDHYGDGDAFDIGGAELTVMQKGTADWTVNERSAVMRLEFGERSMLFMADTTYRTFDALLASEQRQLVDADLMKYPHHGVELLPDAFLQASSPLMAVITNTNRIEETLALLDSEGIAWVLTGETAVHCVTDGEVWLVEPLDVEAEMRGFGTPSMDSVLARRR